MITAHKVKEIVFENNNLILKVNGNTYSIPIAKASSKLANANEIQRGLYKISPSGYGIHWPLIDQDLSIDALIKLAS